MKLLPRHNIGGRIIDLINSAGSYVVLACPYWTVNNWFEIVASIQAAQKRNVKVVAVGGTDAEELALVSAEKHYVSKLHAKLYFNENEAILSSMNINKFSNDNSIDFAILTENKEEHQWVVNFFRNEILDFWWLRNTTRSVNASGVDLVDLNSQMKKYLKETKLKYSYQLKLINEFCEVLIDAVATSKPKLKTRIKFHNNIDIRISRISNFEFDDVKWFDNYVYLYTLNFSLPNVVQAHIKKSEAVLNMISHNNATQS